MYTRIIYFLQNWILYFIIDQFLTSFLKFFRKELHHNSRWFFMHFIGNSIVTYYCFDDVRKCLKHPEVCSSELSSNDSEFALISIFVLHLYHMVIFRKYLKEGEWFHHLLWGIGLSLPTIFFKITRISSLGIWFLSGFPGAIDYLLLWLVKLKLLKSEIEKWTYILITLMIRSPGCLLAVFINQLYSKYNHWTDYTNLGLCILVFWNAQYYTYLTVRDYTKKNLI